MKLLKLTLSNFKGIKSFTLDTQGGNVSVYGDNGVGKTTLWDAFLWLLFDKDSANKKDFAIKALDAAGNVLHGLDHEVEAVLELDGKPLELKKVYRENWVLQRGSTERTFSGHTTECFVHGVPVKKTEYQDRIASIINEDIFKLLTSPTYFNTVLRWEERRRILLEVCGDLPDDYVIALNKDLAELPGILGDRSMDDHKKVIAASRKKINDELQKIPVRIDEIVRGLPDVKGLDGKKLEASRKKLAGELEKKQEEISRIKSGGEIAEKTKALREAESELLDIKNKHRAAVDEQVRSKQIELADLKIKVDNYHRILKNTERERADTLTLISDNEKEAAKLRDQWHEVSGRDFVFEQDENCPTCGQALQAEKLEEAREKALALFNRQKAEKLEEISTKGRRKKAEVESLQSDIDALTKTIVSLKKELAAAEVLAENRLAVINEAVEFASDPAETPDYKAALSRVKTLEAEISDLQAGTNELLTMAQEEADTIREQIQAVDDDLQKLRTHEQSQARTNELKAQEKKLAAEFEQLEHQQYLMDEFTKTKVNAMDEKVNSRFKMARFKMFAEQINGGISETCETLYNGVPYGAGLNNAARINVGLDIINTLSEHYGFTAPIFVDNAEAVTELIDTAGQQIRLVVSGGDKKLRVEIEGEQNTLFEGAM